MQTSSSRNGASKVQIHPTMCMGISQIEKIRYQPHLYKSPLPRHAMKVSLKRNKKLKFYRVGRNYKCVSGKLRKKKGSKLNTLNLNRGEV